MGPDSMFFLPLPVQSLAVSQSCCVVLSLPVALLRALLLSYLCLTATEHLIALGNECSVLLFVYS